jgi:hypothetical protein
MTVKDLKRLLEILPDDHVVYVDWDREGGNETEVTEVILFHPSWVQKEAIKIQ